eukprot:COSAG04_NODE_2913_length_3392_cov_2.741269_5_plen_206_part_00
MDDLRFVDAAVRVRGCAGPGGDGGGQVGGGDSLGREQRQGKQQQRHDGGSSGAVKPLPPFLPLPQKLLEIRLRNSDCNGGPSQAPARPRPAAPSVYDRQLKEHPEAPMDAAHRRRLRIAASHLAQPLRCPAPSPAAATTPAPPPGLSVDLSGRLALVTGATGQLGRTMVKVLATAGADVAVHYRGNREKAESLSVSPPQPCPCLP